MSDSTANNGNGHDEDFYDLTGTLSERGRLRRNAMLSVLQSAVVQEGRRRRVRRFAVRGATTAAVFAAAGVFLINSWVTPTTPNEIPEDRRLEFISIVQVPPGVLERYIVSTDVDSADYIIDDDDLVATLSAIGRPTGLIRSEGKTWLTESVTDAALAPPAEELKDRNPLPVTPRATRPS